jgi:hypothetical protein
MRKKSEGVGEKALKCMVVSTLAVGVEHHCDFFKLLKLLGSRGVCRGRRSAEKGEGKEKRLSHSGRRNR